jgi:hypothetical protein
VKTNLHDEMAAAQEERNAQLDRDRKAAEGNQDANKSGSDNVSLGG